MLVPTDISSSAPIAVSDDMLQSACDYANQKVVDNAGPEFVEGQTLIAKWDFLRRRFSPAGFGYGRILMLDFLHPVDTVSRVTVSGSLLDETLWNIRGPQGLEIRNFNPWNQEIIAEYIPENRNAFRDRIAFQIAIMFIGFPTSMLPSSSGVRVPGSNATYDFSVLERKALGRLNTQMAPIRLPDRTYPKAEE